MLLMYWYISIIHITVKKYHVEQPPSPPPLRVYNAGSIILFV